MTAQGPHPRALCFGPYRLEGREGLLWCRHRVVALSPKAVAILWHLASQAGQLVRKEDLFDAVWPETAVTEGVLAVRIRELRRALADDPQRPRYIETVHRRGCRFMGALRARPSAVSPPRGTFTTPVSPSPPHVPEPPPLRPTFVGREAELAHLFRWYEQTRKGHRQVLFVTGDAGMGKTTLVDAFTAQLGPNEPVWLGRGQCVGQYGVGEAYLPLLEALRQMCRGPGAEVVTAHLRQYAPSWLVQLPAVVGAEERAALRHQVQRVTQTRMLRELAEALEALRNAQSLVFVLEDLHWSDYSIVEAVAMLARRREVARLLVMGTYRPVELILRDHPLKAVKQELQLHGQCADVPLGYLTAAEVQAYLAQRWPAQPATAAVAAWVHQRTEGHPLFMVHVVDDLAQRGRLTDAAAAEDAGRIAPAEAEVPAGLQPLIELQLGRLRIEEQQVLEVASVVGVEFASASVAAGLPIAGDTIEAMCEGLARQGQFLEDLGLAEWPDGTVSGRYGFRHALYQEVLYRRLGSGRRVRVHRAIGARLEVGYGERAPQLAAALAVHFEHGRDIHRAVQYRYHAAQRAIQWHAHREALARVAHGLKLLPRVPNSTVRAQLELGLQTARGVSLASIQGYGAPEVEHAYTRAHELCQDVTDVPTLFAVLCGLWNCSLAQGDLRRVAALADRLLALSQRQPEPALLVLAHTMQGQTDRFLGELATALTHLDQSLARYDAGQHRLLLAQFAEDAGVICHNYAAQTRWLLGYPDQAQRHLDEGRRLARELALPVIVAQDLWRGTIVRQWCGDVRRVADDAQELIGVCQDEALPPWLAGGMILQGWARARQGQGDEGIALIRQGVKDWRTTGTERLRPYYLALLAEACGRAGQPDEGLRALTEALAIVNTTEERWYEAELHRLKGELTLQSHVRALKSRVQKRRTSAVQRANRKASNPQSEAEACFHQALAVARRQQAKSLELRTALSLSRLWQRRGKCDEARQLLAEVYGWFTEGFDTTDLQEAKALLDTLS